MFTVTERQDKAKEYYALKEQEEIRPLQDYGLDALSRLESELENDIED